MIANIGFESNCKRIAKDIIMQCTDSGLIFDFENDGYIVVEASSSLADDFKGNKKKYVKEINKYLEKKGAKVFKASTEYQNAPCYIGWFLCFDIEFDEYFNNYGIII